MNQTIKLPPAEYPWALGDGISIRNRPVLAEEHKLLALLEHAAEMAEQVIELHDNGHAAPCGCALCEDVAAAAWNCRTAFGILGSFVPLSEEDAGKLILRWDTASTPAADRVQSPPARPAPPAPTAPPPRSNPFYS